MITVIKGTGFSDLYKKKTFTIDSMEETTDQVREINVQLIIYPII